MCLLTLKPKHVSGYPAEKMCQPNFKSTKYRADFVTNKKKSGKNL